MENVFSVTLTDCVFHEIFQWKLWGWSKFFIFSFPMEFSNISDTMKIQ
jgi:hypothetical protein